MQPGHAEIVGAGFGGLVAAIALAERGWTVRVHERRDSLRGEGYGIAIHNNMARIFAAFGILDRVLAGGMRIDRRDSVDAQRQRGDDAKDRAQPLSHRPPAHHRAAGGAGAGRRRGTFASTRRCRPPTRKGRSRSRMGKIFPPIWWWWPTASTPRSATRSASPSDRIFGRDCGVRINIPRRPSEIAADDREGTVMIEAWADKRRVLYCPVTKREFYVLLTCTTRDAAAATSPIDPDVWARSFPAMRDAIRAHPRRGGLAAVALGAFPDHPIETLVGRADRRAGRCRARDAALSRARRGPRHDERAWSCRELAAWRPTIEFALAEWERRERPLTEHTQLWTRIYGATMFLPKPLKKISILVEKIPWIAAQYVRAANHVPTGCGTARA